MWAICALSSSYKLGFYRLESKVHMSQWYGADLVYHSSVVETKGSHPVPTTLVAEHAQNRTSI